MLFTSMEFVFCFFPLVVCFYFLLRGSARNVWLLMVSLLFYAWGEPKFVLVMLLSILTNYLLALGIQRTRNASTVSKCILGLGVLINLGLLFGYKYLNFFTQTLHLWFPQTKSMIPATNIVLPIGISFFTFQALSYVIDVYKGVPAQKSIIDLALYISFFPQLIAGPIVRYTTIVDQLKDRTVSCEKFAQGLHRFFIGFNKKVLIANILAEVADTAFAAAAPSTGMAWFGVICYALQIYFDFSGYSDMAIGLGRIFGFEFMENFDYPYISKTITEFWRRWHISLGSWFRDYLYFPLGGSRVKTKGRLLFNLLVVWLATGIWHGANWTFIVWGLGYGLLVIVEKLFQLPKRLSQHKHLSAVYQGGTLLVVLLNWVFFRSVNLTKAFDYFRVMLCLDGNPLIGPDLLQNLRDYAVTAVMGILLSTPVVKQMKLKLLEKHPGSAAAVQAVGLIVQGVLFAVSISFLAMSAHNPFIYFNF
ncbi:MAG: MBOAT family protein [Clostridia bacterium]|nr:MBOAT family protein [Clostridia bacterium]